MLSLLVDCGQTRWKYYNISAKNEFNKWWSNCLRFLPRVNTCLSILCFSLLLSVVQPIHEMNIKLHSEKWEKFLFWHKQRQYIKKGLTVFHLHLICEVRCLLRSSLITQKWQCYLIINVVSIFTFWDCNLISFYSVWNFLLQWSEWTLIYNPKWELRK